jgi:oxygen-independent coproporphyrinogen-3 oxidase
LADLEAALPLIWGRTIHTIFIGGGTPSLFSPQAIDRLLGDIRARLKLEPGCEITLEANPGTFEKDRFRAFRSAGVTRLSVGVQSFNDQHLKALGRVHDSAQARAAVEEAAQAFDTFNLDIMYALPGQTLKDLEQDMAAALAFKPPHISIYHLTIEPNTYFAKFPPVIPEDDMAYAMLDRITELTAAVGMERYEVSAYARAGHSCVHNLNYWQFGDYLGVGAGAHSKLSFAHRIVRQVRWRDPKLYMDNALAGQALAQDEEVSRADLPFEFALNALRLKDGFELAKFSERTGLPLTAIQRALDEGERQGLLARDFARVWPTEKGFDFLSDLQGLFLPA